MSSTTHNLRATVWLMAIACGLAVGNLYYNQPLLAQMRQSLGVSVHAIGVIPLLTQIGYAIGMLIFVPLGDIVERRRLNVALLGAVACALAGAALARNLAALALASLAIGVTTIVPQLLVPFAAHLARPEERGRAVGGVMSGLLIGILVARTVSGYVGAQLGWRAMYWIAAVLMLALAAVLAVGLPRIRPAARLSYLEGMRSLWPLVREEPVLREASLVGAMLFGAFSAFWTTLVFLLQGAPYRVAQPSQDAGLFGLVGVVGAGAAALMGHLADKGSPRLAVGISLGITIASFTTFWLFGHALWGLIPGVILLDFGTQSAQVSNQARIYSLRPDAHSRLNTVYMVTYFIGGSIGSYLGAFGWAAADWNGVCAAGMALQAIAVVVFALNGRRHRQLTVRSAEPTD